MIERGLLNLKARKCFKMTQAEWYPFEADFGVKPGTKIGNYFNRRNSTMLSTFFGLFSANFFFGMIVISVSVLVIVIGTLIWCPKLWNKKEVKPLSVASVPTSHERQQLDLTEANEKWSRNKHAQQLQTAPCWFPRLEEEYPEKEQSVPRPDFKHSLIIEFYRAYIDTRKVVKDEQKNILNKILIILDTYGDCPSVVVNSVVCEADFAFRGSSYDLLAGITLLEHSLNVAREMAKTTKKESHLADAFIVALAHDLGKIPKWHNGRYRTGDHPTLSTIILDEIPEFAGLQNYIDLRNAVSEHHLITTKNTMASKLKECDAVVRSLELSQMGALRVEAMETARLAGISHERPKITVEKTAITTTTATETAMIPVVQGLLPSTDFAFGWDYPVPLAPEPAAENYCPMPPPDPSQVIETAESLAAEASRRYVPKRIDLYWFDAEYFLAELKPRINVLTGKRWGAASMNDGLVYVSIQCFWEVLQQVAPDDIKIILSIARESDKRNSIFTAVRRLGEENQAIMLSYMNPTYNTIETKIIDWNDHEQRTSHGKPFLMIPFKAEAFGVLPSDLEALKTSAFSKVVKRITPIPHVYIKRNE